MNDQDQSRMNVLNEILQTLTRVTILSTNEIQVSKNIPIE